MKYVNIKGINVPVLGFGTWQLTGEGCSNAVASAINIGYRHIDTAQIYENEAEVGRGITNSGIKRTELFLTTKLWTTHFTADKAISSMEASLEKLQTNYVDLLLVHWPNPAVKLSETLSAMTELVKKGKTKFIGVSNFPVSLMREAVETYKADIVCNQVEYHPLLSQNAVLSYARRHHIAITAYSPLARGRLEDNALLVTIARKYGKTPSQVALRWLIEQDGVMAIPKAAKEKHARMNFDIFGFSLTLEDHAAITANNGKTRLINPSFAPQWDNE